VAGKPVAAGTLKDEPEALRIEDHRARQALRHETGDRGLADSESAVEENDHGERQLSESRGICQPHPSLEIRLAFRSGESPTRCEESILWVFRKLT
jgi:hypothetical protein